MFSNDLTSEEAEYMRHVMDELKNVEWIRPLLDSIGPGDRLSSRSKPLLFELRFARELHFSRKRTVSEFGAGIGSSTIDFHVTGIPAWLLEVVSIRASEAAQKAVIPTGPVGFIDGKPVGKKFHREFSSSAERIPNSFVGEMVKVQEKIGEKVFKKGTATKFPAPKENTYHVLLVDMRGYLDQGEGDCLSDLSDYRQIAYGIYGANPEVWPPHIWGPPHGKLQPIVGLFDPRNPQGYARYLREKIHFVGFIREMDYKEGEIERAGCYFPNPHLFSDITSARKAAVAFPLKMEIR